MIISKLVLKNWRNFRSADIELTNRVFVIGANASGKSNLLDVFRFLRDVSKDGGGLQRSLAQRGGLSKVRCLAARREPDVEIEIELGEVGEPAIWRYGLGIKQQVRGHRQSFLTYERVCHKGTLILNRPDEEDKRDWLRLTQTHLEQISANAEFREVARFLSSIRYLHLVPQMLRHPESFQGMANEDDPFGRNFLEMVAKTSEKTRRYRLRRIEAALRRAVPNLKDLVDTKDESGIPHLEAVYEHWRPNAGRQREDQFSDGTLRLIGLFWSLLDGEAPLLLEEPELNLHSEIIRKLPDLFYRLETRRKRQLFISTHSMDLLSDKGIDPAEVVLLVPDSEGTKVTLGASDRDIREGLKGGLSIADIALPKTAPRHLGNLNLFE